MIVSDILCVLGLHFSVLNIPVYIKHKRKPMPIYCIVMSDVKQESLANAKVRISSACKAPSKEIYGKLMQGT